MTAHFSAELRRTTVIFSPSRPTPTHPTGVGGGGRKEGEGRGEGFNCIEYQQMGSIVLISAGGWGLVWWLIWRTVVQIWLTMPGI